MLDKSTGESELWHEKNAITDTASVKSNNKQKIFLVFMDKKPRYFSLSRHI